MTLRELLNGIEVQEITGDTSCEITGIAYNSRRITPGALFVALHGENTDGAVFVEDAIRRGAAAVLSQSPCATGNGVPCIQVDNARKVLAKLSGAFYNHPAERLCSVGITGTNGKTTVSFMLREIFKAAGKHPGLIGTVRYEIGDRVVPAARTTPESPDIQAMLAQMERSGCDSVIMEVSSHALDQYRVYGILYDAAVFTNLTQDHLDYHGTFEEYFAVKTRLFRQVSRFAVINRDDSWGRRLLTESRFIAGCVSYGFDEGADVRGQDPVTDTLGSRMRVESPWGAAEISLQLIGRFNLHNALAAFATAAALGIPVDTIAKALAEMENVPGRLEAIPNKKGKRVFVDYAHTDDALLHVLEALRAITPGKLIVVFGCGGNRDTDKRRLMGQVAARLADYSIITNDNPRNETPENIAADIAAGFDSERKYEVVLDRRAAILRGLELTGKKDVLLVAGKGHETYQEFAGTIVPFDDREIVREAL
ncbi:MAG: UDP-N-acetylmuramoyl-L-alanyl-D-glutamate--2,6-diaminopimelate ligase [Verrucomicrobiota bacterium]|nr:UDP-N-acetylmuramoyl-L-alanyl-D-glutamate--2,6-diaminopimelate ligase [Verrucomicrobiota bacterium]MDK2964164.1 UDP-N-acetylmuramoyl-L-alanyl-D-glutamate--2,6-diaminopimelate ligase [Verrucomicrobiota bacterium]